MRETTGNLWELHEKGTIVCITTNGAVSRQGRAQMLRGCARQAAERFPDLASRLGALVAADGNHVHDLGGGVVSFPVEDLPMTIPILPLSAVLQWNSWNLPTGATGRRSFSPSSAVAAAGLPGRMCARLSNRSWMTGSLSSRTGKPAIKKRWSTLYSPFFIWQRVL